MTRILIFSPYSLWRVHTVYDETIAKACRVRGAEVEYLLCDGLLPECDQHWDSKANTPRPFDLCQRCQSATKVLLAEIGFPQHWLGEYVDPSDRAEAFAWAHSVIPTGLRQARFREHPLGVWVLSSVISYFRQYPPDTSDWRVVSVYRGFLFSAALVATGIQNFLKKNRIDSAVVFNGRQSITRVALELFQQRGIRVLTTERPEYERGHLNVKPNAHCMSLAPFKALWSTWAQVPLTRASLQATLKWLVQRRYGANLAWIPYNTSWVRNSSLRARLNLSRDKHLLALFTSSMDELAADPERQGPYDSQIEWVREVVDWVRNRTDVEMVIKVHPNLGGNSYIGKAVDELRTYEEMKLTLPRNVRMVMPEDSINAYQLTDEADIGLTFGSTIGLEMAMLGKPVILASRALYEYGSQILTVRAKELLPQILERCLQPFSRREIQREAFRIAYYYIFVFEVPFPAVQVSGVYEAKANYNDLDCLACGKDDSLDHICDFLIHDCPLFDSPTAEDTARTTVEEDAFFERLDRSPNFLRNDHYEYWLWCQSVGRLAAGRLKSLPFGVGNWILELGRGRWKLFLHWLETRA
jgi:hypothetical protein